MKKILLIILCIAFFAGCSTTLQNVKDMTPEQKATWMMGVYNSQFDNTMEMAKRPDLTEEQKVIVRSKKKVLQKVKPLIALYKEYVKNGAMPSQETEDEILKLLDELTMMIL